MTNKMYSYIPIIDIELIDFSKLSIKDKKILYDSSELSIKISSTKIGLSYNKDSIQLYSNLLFKLRTFIDELYKETLSDEKLKFIPCHTYNNIHQIRRSMKL